MCGVSRVLSLSVKSVVECDVECRLCCGVSRVLWSVESVVEF